MGSSAVISVEECGDYTMAYVQFRRILVRLVFAMGVSLAVHFVLFVIMASNLDDHSVIMRIADLILSPANRITNVIANGHTLTSVFYGFVISTILYAGVFWIVAELIISISQKIRVAGTT
jgi:hypothetical protein